MLRKTRLIQRLLEPQERQKNLQDITDLSLGSREALAFDMHRYRKLVSKEDAINLCKIIDFDYMGNANFEWGEVPRALEYMAGYVGDNEHVTGKLTFKKDYRNPHAETDVHYLCHKEHQKYVEAIILHLAGDGAKELWQLAKDLPKPTKLKEPVFLQEVLQGGEGYQQFKGGMELNNGFLFLVDAEMYRKTIEFFKQKWFK